MITDLSYDYFSNLLNHDEPCYGFFKFVSILLHQKGVFLFCFSKNYS